MSKLSIIQKISRVVAPICLLLILACIFAPKTVFAATPDLSPSYSGKFGSEGSGNGELGYPFGVTLSPDGSKIYIADAGNNRIQIFNAANNAYIGQFGTEGSGNGEFLNPIDVDFSLDGSKIYVADEANNRIQIFNATNNAYLGQFGGEGSGNGEFFFGMRVTISPDGSKIYVADVGNGRVQIFNATTNAYLGQFGSSGSGNGEFAYNYGIALSPDGSKIYIADRGNNRIQIFNAANNAYIGQFGSFGSDEGEFAYPNGIALSPDGSKIYVAEIANNRIQVFNAANNAYIGQIGSEGSGDGQFDDLQGVSLFTSPDGSKIYVADTGNNRVQIFSYPNYKILKSNAVTTAVNVPDDSELTCSEFATEESLATPDTGYQYPLGLVDFCFTNEETDNQVSITFKTDLTPDQVTARKYNPTTNSYADISGASITETTYAGEHALVVTYTVADNGPLDVDPAIGSIQDPMGLAVQSGASGEDQQNSTLAATGQPAFAFMMLGVISLASSLGVLVHLKKQADL